MRTRKPWFLLLYLSILSTPLYATLKVGTAHFFPPFVMSMSEGFDIELIKLLCQRMKQNCELVMMDFHDIFPALDSGKIDLAISGIAISPARLQKYKFSLPYLVSREQFLVLGSSNIKALNNLQGKSVGVIKGEEDDSLTFQFSVQSHNNKFKVIEYNDMEELIDALSNMDIAAALLHRSTANYWVQNGGTHFKTLGKPEAINQGIAIIALPRNSALIQNINQALESVEKDNTYIKLYQTYMVKFQDSF